MRRTSAYFISLLIIQILCSLVKVTGQDTISFPLKIKAGVEISGPIMYIANKDILDVKAYLSYDINEKLAAVLGGGYLDYKYSQYNYEYLNQGYFITSGIDFNMLKPKKSSGNYWAGFGLKYGLSHFTSEIPYLKQDNYWGTTESSVEKTSSWGHFLEISPGVRAEMFRHFEIGWNISMRILLYTGTGKDLRPIYFPGFGNGDKTITTGLTYYLVWNIPYRQKTVIIKKEVPEESEDTEDPGIE